MSSSVKGSCVLKGHAMCYRVERGTLRNHGDLVQISVSPLGKLTSLGSGFLLAERGAWGPLLQSCEKWNRAGSVEATSPKL